MDKRTKQVRDMLRAMAPVDAVAWLAYFELPREQEIAIVEHECRDRSLQQIADELSVTADTVKTYRARALMRIANSLCLQ